MHSYVVFCDESSHTNQPKRRFLCIGSLWVPKDEKAEFTQQIKNIKKERGLRGEVKWSKVSSVCFDGYRELVDFFIAQDSMRFRVIVIDLEKVRFDEFHEGDTELGFYKFYYHMLYQWLEDGNEYLILLDFKSN
jgi:hypothetical protein